jgi:hypothetical protein
VLSPCKPKDSEQYGIPWSGWREPELYRSGLRHLLRRCAAERPGHLGGFIDGDLSVHLSLFAPLLHDDPPTIDTSDP